MSIQSINVCLKPFRFCFHCLFILKEHQENIQWYGVNFCNITCFGNAHCGTSCKNCNNEIPSEKICFYSIKIGLSVFHFCSPDCFQVFKSNVFCAFCFAETDDAIKSKSSNKKDLNFCSRVCLLSYDRIFYPNSENAPVDTCLICVQQKPAEFSFLHYNETEHFCSIMCFKDFKNRTKINCKRCHLCRYYFNANNNEVYFSQVGQTTHIFCGDHCMHLYEANYKIQVACKTCNYSKPFFKMIRNTYSSNSVWCSLACAQQYLDKYPLSENDNITENSCGNETGAGSTIDMDLDEVVQDDIEDYFDDTEEGNSRSPAIEEGNEGNEKDQDADFEDLELNLVTNEENNKTKKIGDLPVLQQSAIEAARNERVASFQRFCSDCYSIVTVLPTFLTWQCMDFCNAKCLENFITTAATICKNCDERINYEEPKFYILNTGMNINYFCNDTCFSAYKDKLKLCFCCQKKITLEEKLSVTFPNNTELDFCSKLCAEFYEKNFYREPAPIPSIEECTKCGELKRVKMNLLIGNHVYAFCSMICFFLIKHACNFFTDRCAMCDKYFFRKYPDSYTIHLEDKTVVLCSDICKAVYLRSNAVSINCKTCSVSQDKFDMFQRFERNKEITYFCSLDCYRVFHNQISSEAICNDDDILTATLNLVEANIMNDDDSDIL